MNTDGVTEARTEPQLIFHVQNLVAGYAGKAVARLPSLSIRAGEAALLTGRSGSGKTTALLAIAGLTERIEGTSSPT